MEPAIGSYSQFPSSAKFAVAPVITSKILPDTYTSPAAIVIVLSLFALGASSPSFAFVIADAARSAATMVASVISADSMAEPSSDTSARARPCTVPVVALECV